VDLFDRHQWITKKAPPKLEQLRDAGVWAQEQSSACASSRDEQRLVRQYLSGVRHRFPPLDGPGRRMSKDHTILSGV
jgi:hypothetical protein